MKDMKIKVRRAIIWLWLQSMVAIIVNTNVSPNIVFTLVYDLYIEVCPVFSLSLIGTRSVYYAPS